MRARTQGRAGTPSAFAQGLGAGLHDGLEQVAHDGLLAGHDIDRCHHPGNDQQRLFIGAQMTAIGTQLNQVVRGLLVFVGDGIGADLLKLGLESP